jgi:mRNA interferase RelE/StbE
MKCEFRNSFARDLRARRKDQDFLDHVKEAIEEIEQAQDLSEISNLKKLKGESDYYRIRFGNFRIGVKVENDLVIFIRALHRRDIYRYFP